ncbi:MAG: RluA family pseudouridine synthase [Clostridia bacterium]|nr:RluA family pseudouridine synthase [Clostridia bacterium]
MRKLYQKDKPEREKKERAPVYTAVYKANRSEELLPFLLRKCATSRNNVKSLLTRGQVLVNGSVVTRHDCALAKDDEVKISKTPNKVDRGKATLSARQARPKPLPFKIIYEDDDFIAIDKPAGLLSVESDKERTCAFGYVMDYLRGKDKTARPYILHRIDKETSGVLVFAKNVKVHSMLKLHWNECVTLRQYHAVVQGALAKKEDVVTSYLKENANNLVYITHDTTGQKAITRYKVLKEKEGYALLSVQIETGRKNQIRVQMQALGAPVVGDDKYGDGKGPLGRLGLHASALTFKHPATGKELSFSAPCPMAFKSMFP